MASWILNAIWYISVNIHVKVISYVVKNILGIDESINDYSIYVCFLEKYPQGIPAGSLRYITLWVHKVWCYCKVLL